jgi:hypothetical protein
VHNTVCNRRLAKTFALALPLFAACSAAPDEPVSTPGERDTDPGVPGEEPDAPSADKALECVYVQWCDAPGWRGTTCRIRSNCTHHDYEHTLWLECINDTNYVCGRPVGYYDLLYPWEPL